MKKNRRKERRPRTWRTQREVLCDVMLAAWQCETWLTLHELGRLTGYGEASVSAQLRHLRKPEYGGYELEKRHRAGAHTVHGETGLLWEYQLCDRPRRVLVRRGSRKNRGATMAVTI
jgi:hypothetical protein